MTRSNQILRNIRAFTLMEIMVVLVILIIMAAFAIPNYSDSVNRTRIRDAVAQLSVLNAANAVYNAQAGAYYPGTLTIDAINTALNINLIANGVTYTYTRSSATAYSATAVYGSTFTIRVNEASISSSNPCCCSSVSTCYSIVSACASPTC